MKIHKTLLIWIIALSLQPILVSISLPSHFINSAQAATTSLPDLLFTAASPWNQPIGSNVQLDPNSQAMVAAVDTRVNPTDQAFGMPMYTSTSSDPTCSVQLTGGGDEPFQSDQPIHIPANAAASTGDDHWLFVYDTTKNLVFEMWEAQKSGSCWTANTGNVYSPTGDGVLQPNGQPQDGNGSSYFAGVINANDMKRGSINHALSLVSQNTVANQGRYPMNQKTDGGNGAVPMGARFQLDPTFNCDGMSGASKGEIMVCHAMQTYGGYMRDTGGVPLSIYFQEDTSAGGIMTAAGVDENTPFSHIPWNRLRVLKSWNSYTGATINPVPSVVCGGSTNNICNPLTPTVAPTTSNNTNTPSAIPSPQILPSTNISQTPCNSIQSTSALQSVLSHHRHHRHHSNNNSGNNGLLGDLLKQLLALLEQLLGGNNTGNTTVPSIPTPSQSPCPTN